MNRPTSRRTRYTAQVEQPPKTRLEEKVKIKKHFPIDIAEESFVLRVSHIRVDFQGIEMIGQVHHCCGQPNRVFGRELDVLRGAKVK